MGEVMLRGWIYVIIGVIAIGFGGVLSTLGWNTVNKYSQMKALIIAVAREWELNESILKDKLFNKDEVVALGSRKLYPRLRSNALNTFLSSGIFTAQNIKNRNFLKNVADYEYAISDTNSRLNVSDNFILSTQDTEAIMKHRKHVIESKGFKGFLDTHSFFRQALVENYKWVFNEQFLN